MSGDGGDGRQGKRDEVGYEGPEFGGHEFAAGLIRPGPVQIVAVGEELAMCGGDQGRGR